MNEDSISEKSPVKRLLTWLLRIILGLVGLFILLVVSVRNFVILETPFHALVGWLLHIFSTIPPLLGSWRMMLLPVACLMVAGFILHRFIRWWLKEKGFPQIWRPANTAIVLGIILLGSGAAIAMSGIVHQLVWLSKDPWTEDRSRNIHITVAMNNARQLMFMTAEYQIDRGRFPDSLQELEEKYQIPQKLSWVQTGNGNAPEPFVLLKPGGAESGEEIEPWIVSPVIGPHGKIVVGYSDGSAISLPASQLEQILQSRDFKSGSNPAR